MARPRVVLLGAGHAHLEVVRRAAELRAAGADVVLVTADDLWYSGLASAVVGGRLPPERDRVDVAALCAANDVALVRGRAVGLDTGARAVTVAAAGTDGEGTHHERYDLLSLNVGSDLALGDLEVDLAAPDVVGVKPIREHDRLHRLVHGGLRDGDVRVTVVGGGASAVEYAANLALLRRPERPRHRPRVTLVSGTTAIVPPAPDAARRRLLALLDERGVAVVRGGRATRIAAGTTDVTGPDGTAVAIEHDVAVLATGLQAARAVRDLGLGDERGMVTDAQLAHPDHPDVLGAGDAICFRGEELPRLGVFGVRQAPVLVDNLVARLTGGRPRPYEPQQRVLAVMDLGGGTALAVRGRRWWEGGAALVLKRVLDERWLRRYRP